MTAAQKLKPLTMVEFEEAYEETRCQFHEGEVWEAQATTAEHNNLQGAIGELLRMLFHKKGGLGKPGGWWILPESAVRYSLKSYFIHDLAGWRRLRVPEIPKGVPITIKPDWVCEILSSNETNDLIKKKAVLHEHEVPFYWIVHPTEKVITVYEWSVKGYVSILDVTEGFVGKIPPFDAVILKANVLFGEEDE
jgi:Uma2 family endonuclease